MAGSSHTLGKAKGVKAGGRMVIRSRAGADTNFGSNTKNSAQCSVFCHWNAGYGQTCDGCLHLHIDVDRMMKADLLWVYTQAYITPLACAKAYELNGYGGHRSENHEANASAGFSP